MKELIHIQAGYTVQAFHPRRFGVINTARVMTVGPKLAVLDFGALLGGVTRVRRSDIVSVEETS